MMELLSSFVRKRQSDLDARLAKALESGADAQIIEALEEEGQLLRGVQARITPQRPAWLVPAIVAGVALMAITLGLLIRIKPLVSLDAQATEIQFTAAPDRAPFATGRPITVTDFEIIGDEDAATASGAPSIQSITVFPGTQVTVSTDNQHCHSVTVGAGNGSLDLKIGEKPVSNMDLPTARSVLVLPGVGFRFCSKEAGAALFAGPVTDVRVWRVHRADKTPILLSSIVSGTLRINQTKREDKLNHRDRLWLSAVEEGWLTLTPGNELHILFSGLVGEAKWIGVSAREHEDFSPSMLEAITKWSEFSAVISAFAGLVSIVFGVRRYFGFS